jgi:hypothetical protein
VGFIARGFDRHGAPNFTIGNERGAAAASLGIGLILIALIGVLVFTVAMRPKPSKRSG